MFKKKEYLDKVALSGITIFKISLGDGGITVLGKEYTVGDGEFEEKFRVLLYECIFLCLAIICYKPDKLCLGV